MLTTGSRGRSPAIYDHLARSIHAAIDLLKATGAIRAPDADDASSPYNDYCARACAAYAYLAAHEPRARPLCQNRGMKLKKLQRPGAAYGDSHYWLEDDEGRVLDLIFTERKRLPRDIPYAEGKGASLQSDRADPTLPARKDTQRIIAVVRAGLA